MQVYEIIKHIFDLEKEVGGGMHEPVYQKMLEVKFDKALMPNEPQKEIDIEYHGVKIEKIYKPDFVCFGNVILEIKAVKDLAAEHRVQLFNYMRLTHTEVGILANFRYDKAICERYFLDMETNKVYPFHYDKITKEPVVDTSTPQIGRENS